MDKLRSLMNRLAICLSKAAPFALELTGKINPQPQNYLETLRWYELPEHHQGHP